jgi:putative salt-induced outer membrane protein
VRQIIRFVAAVSLCLPFAATGQEDLPMPAPDRAASDEVKLWDTEAELGASTTSGNTETSTTHARIASERTGKRFSLHLLAEGHYSEEDGDPTSQRAHGLSQLDYEFHPRVYGFAVLEATHDRFSGYDARLQEAVGLGRRMLDREDMVWRIEAGPAVRQEWRTDDTYENSYRARARTLYSWDFREGSRFRQELIYSPSLESNEDWLLTSDTSLAFRLNSMIAFKTAVRVEHDNDPVEGAEKTDVFTTTSLLFHF